MSALTGAPAGSGKRTLVLLPGMDGTGDLFEPLLTVLGDGFAPRVVRYPNQALGYASLVEVARTALPMDQPFFLLGESFSGPIALTLAASQPPGLQGVILSASFMRNPRAGGTVLRFIIDLLPLGTLPIAVVSYWLLGSRADAALRAALAAALTQIAPDTWKARIGAVLSVDVSAHLQATTVPLLYLQAQHDRLVPPSAAQLMLRARPNMQVVAIPAPHLLLQVAPHAAVDAIERFAEDCFRRRH